MSRGEGRASAAAGALLRLLARLVPAPERRDWYESWRAELDQLTERRRNDPALPSPLRFVAGALPHSLWERKEWTMSVLLQDTRFALRVLTRTPAFTALAILTVALGVGSSTTVFSLLSATVLRAPGGIVDPGSVVQIGRQNDGGYDNLAYPFIEAFGEVSSLESTAGYTYRTLLLGRGEATLPHVGQLVTGAYFDLLGVGMRLGRPLAPTDMRSAEPVAVISERLWRDRFGGLEQAVGSDLIVNGRPYRVVGVAGPGFHGTDVAQPPADVWLPLSLAGPLLGESYAGYDDPGFSWLWALGRLRDDASLPQASEEVDAVYSAVYRAAWGEEPTRSTILVRGPGLRPEERETLGRLIGLLLGIVAVVMLVASANLGSLMLARGMARVREMGVRVALGASRVRIVRQMLTEAVLLSLAGGAIALVATIWTARILPTLIPWPLGVELSPDVNVLAFGLLCSILVGLLFGGLPALRASSGDVTGALRQGGRRAGLGGLLLRRGLVVGQLALSFALIVVVGLLVMSLRQADRAEPGFSTRDVVVARLDLDLAGFDPAEGRLLRRELLERVRALPGVSAAALGGNVPFAGWSRESLTLPEPTADGRDFFEFDTTVVSDDYFDTLRQPLLRGAGFSTRTPLPADEIVISESAARLLFPDEEPLGAVVPVRGSDERPVPLRVVGIAGDVRQRGLRIDPRPSIYLPDTFRYQGRLALFVRGSSPADLATSLRGTIAEVDPDLAILAVTGLHEQMIGSLRDTRLVARLATIFGLLALALASVGLYGVIAYLVGRRRHEVGVRMALGASAGDVVALVGLQGLSLAAAGLLLGLVVAIPSARTLRGLYYGVDASSPVALGGAALLLLGIAAAASIVPCRRATRIDPARTLHAD